MSFGGGTKTAWQKFKFVTSSFFNFYFAPYATIACKAASTQRPYLMHQFGASCGNTRQNCGIVTQHDGQTL